jgi:UDPglucose--hexose-1-phosphate uridylyltransferase
MHPGAVAEQTPLTTHPSLEQTLSHCLAALGEAPHRRTDPLTGRHILVSPHRSARPWLGHREDASGTAQPSYDPECYLCPGNTRIGGTANPAYDEPFVFDNDFPALLPVASAVVPDGNALFAASIVRGTSRVICFSPDHSATLASLPAAAVRAVIDCWCSETAALGRDYTWVQVFENKGAMMGCSNPHPHGQVWATDFLPDEAMAEDTRQRAYFAAHGRSMLADVAALEIEDGARVVLHNEHWLVIVPFWAAWPFETLVLPRFPVARMPDLDLAQRDGLALAIQALTRTYDALFGVSFPYSMGWHGAPFGPEDTSGWQLHAHFYPPLLRSATVRKFMVGYEMLAEAQRDLTPEQAAARLRDAYAKIEA